MSVSDPLVFCCVAYINKYILIRMTRPLREGNPASKVVRKPRSHFPLNSIDYNKLQPCRVQQGYIPQKKVLGKNSSVPFAIAHSTQHHGLHDYAAVMLKTSRHDMMIRWYDMIICDTTPAGIHSSWESRDIYHTRDKQWAGRHTRKTAAGNLFPRSMSVKGQLLLHSLAQHCSTHAEQWAQAVNNGQ